MLASNNCMFASCVGCGWFFRGEVPSIPAQQSENTAENTREEHAWDPLLLRWSRGGNLTFQTWVPFFFPPCSSSLHNCNVRWRAASLRGQGKRWRWRRRRQLSLMPVHVGKSGRRIFYVKGTCPGWVPAVALCHIREADTKWQQEPAVA